MLAENRLITREDNLIVGMERIYGNKSIFDSKNNKACIRGIIEKNFQYSHEILGIKYYTTRVRVTRISGKEDFVPIMVSQELIQTTNMYQNAKGKFVEICGQLRTYNMLREDGKKHLEIFLFAKSFNVYAMEEKFQDGNNLIYLDAYLCQKPILKVKQKGKKVTELKLALNRNKFKVEYIPCIAWELNAQKAGELEIGKRIKIYGRIQSRTYLKNDSINSKKQKRMTYEVSVILLDC